MRNRFSLKGSPLQCYLQLNALYFQNQGKLFKFNQIIVSVTYILSPHAQMHYGENPTRQTQYKMISQNLILQKIFLANIHVTINKHNSQPQINIYKSQMNHIDLKWITHQPGYRDDPLQFSVGAALTLMDKIPKALLQGKIFQSSSSFMMLH